jgi:hypothetical protein
LREWLVVRAVAVALVPCVGAGLLGCRTPEQPAFESRRLALSIAEAGANAGKAYLKDHCLHGRVLESLLSTPQTVHPLPVVVPEGDAGAQRALAAGATFQVTVQNNADDPRFGDGRDSDGIVTLVVIGTGPLRHEVTLELRLDATRCPEEVLVSALAVPRWR